MRLLLPADLTQAAAQAVAARYRSPRELLQEVRRLGPEVAASELVEACRGQGRREVLHIEQARRTLRLLFPGVEQQQQQRRQQRQQQQPQHEEVVDLT